VHAIIGGFHLKEVNEITTKTIAYLKKQNIERIYPSHCVDEAVIKEFERELKAKRIRSGDVIDL
jgi:7,8-dihydropterin-6-yl-methyl-4-(beta-D-ribofuranosyl)aminobenzene 5'-phosphate synthase